MVYSKNMEEIYGELMYPKALSTIAFSITPTIKEVVASWGAETKGAKQMGIKVKGTHFKLDTPVGKLGIKEIHILHAKDEGDFTNLYTHRYAITAIPKPKEPRQKP